MQCFSEKKQLSRADRLVTLETLRHTQSLHRNWIQSVGHQWRRHVSHCGYCHYGTRYLGRGDVWYKMFSTSLNNSSGRLPSSFSSGSSVFPDHTSIYRSLRKELVPYFTETDWRTSSSLHQGRSVGPPLAQTTSFTTPRRQTAALHAAR
ncbi:hypothetical protein GMOD_00000387 [Pyrenophora seminiperda CCB06]|uniref:Uncharacterized protein n=1 Tax=Pyrenophora seminiperda CCB06 TaxID=1302712 RepID=A0A3M7M759_9PLEO|nr:hypothetical protein GMOD_00000387 [Pyrenophora seminiperda CCB06]